MRILYTLILFFLSNLLLLGQTLYTPTMLVRDGKPAKMNLAAHGFFNNFEDGRLMWIVGDIQEGEYFVHFDSRNDDTIWQGKLYHNGIAINVDCASPAVKSGKAWIMTCQSEKIRVKKGDSFRLAGRTQFGNLKLSTQPLKFAPQKFFRVENFAERGSYDLDGTDFGEKFLLKITNLTGSKKKICAEIKITDFFQNELNSWKGEFELEGNFSKEVEYKNGGSDQYRAIVKITDQRGIQIEKIYSRLSDCSNDVRKKIWLNSDWERTWVADDASEQTRFIQKNPPQNAKWENVKLPAEVKGTLSWFRRKFNVPTQFKGARYFLCCSMAKYEFELYINGKKVGEHGKDGVNCGSFEIELTDKFNIDGENEILIAARGRLAALEQSQLKNKNINFSLENRPITGISAIGEIFLQSRPKDFIGDVAIETSYRDRKISVRTDIPKGFSVSHKVLRQGKELLRFKDCADWKNPVLWGPNEFPLLQLRSEMFDKKGNLCDVKNTRFGFREIWADGMNILWNGKNFRGTGRAMMSTWSAYLFDKRNRRDDLAQVIADAKKLGTRQIRHIYNDSPFLEFADEIGIIVCKGGATIAGASPYKNENDIFWKNKEENDAAMIRSFRNHPSIFTWYISNEYFAFSEAKNRARISHAVAAAERLDPTRFVEAGCDIDLRGQMKINSVHYPDKDIFRKEKAYLPDALYWRGLDESFKVGDHVPMGITRNVANVFEASPIEWGKKPIIVNECCWDEFFNPPFGMTRVAHDEIFQSPSMVDKWHIQIQKLAFLGMRDACAAEWTPWRHVVGDFTNYIAPQLDISIVQKYGCFYEGEKVELDVNIFHDILSKEDVKYYWKLYKCENSQIDKGETKPLKSYLNGGESLCVNGSTSGAAGSPSSCGGLVAGADGANKTGSSCASNASQGGLQSANGNGSVGIDSQKSAKNEGSRFVKIKKFFSRIFSSEKQKKSASHCANNFQMGAEGGRCAPLAGGEKNLHADFCKNFREKIVIEPMQAGEYILEFGIKNEVSQKRKIKVYTRKNFKLPSNIISAETKLDKSLLERVKNGETITLLARSDYPAWLPELPQLTEHRAAICTSFYPSHPVLRGIAEDELRYWFPRHVVSEGSFFKQAGNARAIIEAGGPQGLLYVALLEVPYGKGSFIYSRLNLDAKKNPIALKLLENLAQYKSDGENSIAAFVSDSPEFLVKLIGKYNLNAQKIKIEDINKYQAVIVDGSVKISAEQLKMLENSKAKIAVVNPSESFGVEFAKMDAKTWKGRAIKVSDSAELFGLTNQDMMWRKTFNDPSSTLDSLGFFEMKNVEPLIYPVFMGKKNGIVYLNMNFNPPNSALSRIADYFYSKIFSNLGVKIKVKAKLKFPENLNYSQIDISKFLTRGLVDLKEDDGVGSWNDQGADTQMELSLDSGVQTLGGVPFFIRMPNCAVSLASKYRKGGLDCFEFSVGKKIRALFWLHTCAWTSAQHHYSVFVNYSDGTSYEIQMLGKRNLRDWTDEPTKLFSTELDTLTKPAIFARNKKFGHNALYSTAWLNPFPEKKIDSVKVQSMRNGLPAIFAFTVGSDENEYAALSFSERSKLHSETVSSALNLQKTKKYMQAVSLYEKALKMRPEELSVYRSIGACYEAVGDFKNALATYERSLKADVNQPDILDSIRRMKSATEKSKK